MPIKDYSTKVDVFQTLGEIQGMLVDTWRKSFNLPQENLFVETDKKIFASLNYKPFIKGSKTLAELFAAQNVFFREVEE